jgi:hypothetical protein
MKRRRIVVKVEKLSPPCSPYNRFVFKSFCDNHVTTTLPKPTPPPVQFSGGDDADVECSLLVRLVISLMFGSLFGLFLYTKLILRL